MNAILPDAPPLAGSRETGCRWAVVGGGILGMELARQLRAAGHAVTLFEAAPHFGGLADAWRIGDLTWDRHYHVTLLSDLRLRSLLDQLGLADDLRWVETKTGFYTDGKLYSMSNTLEFLKFPPLRMIDKLRLGTTIAYASKIKNWKRLEAIPVEQWLRKWSGSRTTEKIWLPLLRAKLGENYRHASAAFIWAIIARMYAARKSGMKKEQFGYICGGYARINDEFVRKLGLVGVTLRPNAKIESITADGRYFDIATRDEAWQFDRVVVTTPSPVAMRLCPSLTVAERQRHADVRYRGIICASILLSKPLTPYYVTNITEPTIPFTAVIGMTTLVDPAEFGGRHLVYLPKYADPQSSMFDQPDAAIRFTFLEALSRMFPDFEESWVLDFKVSRVRHVLAISTLNYSEKLPAMATSVPGFYIVNSAQIAHGTLNVNETLLLADRGMQAIGVEG
jgi:protoporphyrinogen oxidase